MRLQVLGEASGLQGSIARVLDATIPWLVVVATGVLTGILAASIDICSIYLSDLREGVCVDAFWMSRSICCMGLDGEFARILLERRYATDEAQWARLAIRSSRGRTLREIRRVCSRGC